MPDIHIERAHSLGLARARKLAQRWAQAAQEKLGMECSYEKGDVCDVVAFSRSGASGELEVTASSFVLNAKLGLLLGAFKGRIESEIVSNLDELLAHKEPLKAFDKALAAHAAAPAEPRKKKA